MFSIKFLGVGNAFTLPEDEDLNNCDWQSNLIVIAESGKKLLLDCGSDIRFSLMQAGYSLADIDAIYISHAHADHIGGMEWLGFETYFDPGLKKPDLFCASALTDPLWDESLKGGLDSIEGVAVDLATYCTIHSIQEGGHFIWEEIHFKLVQVLHVVSGERIKSSYGLLISKDGENGPKIFWTSDTRFCPDQIKVYYEEADLILHDTETAPSRTGVHSHYDDLVGLPSEVKKRMALYHYHPGTPEKIDAVAGGFMGFIRKGDIFEIGKTIKWIK